MTRRSLAISVLGVAAPICLLAVAWVADQMFHHPPCEQAPPAPVDVFIQTVVAADVETDGDANVVPSDLVPLTLPELRLQLRRDTARCDGWRAATWLLHELDGAPLPRAAHNRPKRVACEGPWRQADPGQAD